MKRILSLVVALAMLIGMLPQFTLPARAEETKTITNELEGKTISILGDSISTYSGVSNSTSYNSTIGSNAVYYSAGTQGVYRADTWWQQTIDALGMELLVNNSWSGSTVLHTRSGTVGAYVDRAVQLHNDHTGETPDVIAVFMGTNDYSYYQDKLGTADVDYGKLITENSDGTFTYAAPTTTCEAYAIMLHKMTERYPNAEIYCMGLLPRRNPDYDGKDVVPAPTEFNGELKKVIEQFGCTYVDIESPIPAEGTEFDKYIGDKRVHPNATGMDKMTEALLSAMLKENITLYNISYDLQNAAADTSTAAAIGGKEFSANVSAAENCDNLSVKVTMGGEDVTAEVYADGKISIANVNGDVEICAKAVRPAKDFRWEFDGTNLVSVGETENKLTKLDGTTENGILKNTYYSLEESVMLYHNREWAVEFKVSGSWSGMLFSSEKTSGTKGNIYFFKTTSTSGLIAFGERDSSQYNNYGVPLTSLGVDTTEEHVYRIENRIAQDGTNMAYLFVDGAEHGAMNDYYVGGSTNQNEKVDWISGKDFAFSYIGASSHALNNCALDYLSVQECVHSYENGSCTVCGAEHPNLANYEGKVISVLGDSISTFAGYIPTADGFNLEHLARYPQDNLLTDVNETWWMQVIAGLGGKLGINDSWRGATVSGAKPVTTGTTGENAAMSNLTRIQNLGANGTPDVILFYGGTNDLAHVSDVGSFDPDTAPAVVDLTTKKWDNLADGYVHTLLRLRYYYPDATVIAMLPTYTASYYSEDKLAQANAVLAQICQHYDVTYVDLRDCGISTGDLPDGIHPDANGMDYISAAVMDALLDECEMEAGENVVYSVTHRLTGAESTLGYYKGVTQGKSFVTTITGEDVVASVAMGGVDITDTVYANGVVTIGEVTGDIVITAEGRVKAIYEDHLQQLPQDLCSETNLWAALEHDKQYYTASGWGTHSSGTVYSVTFPVSAGDRIYATSFGAAGSNGSSTNGIRVTWFDENGLLATVSTDKVYAEFSANGYLSVPEGATIVSIPMWTVSDANEIYILNRDHTYENGACTACGVAQWDTDGDGALEILAIGNSFSVDALQYAYQIAQDLGIEKIVIGNLYIGGCSLSTHATNAAGDLGKYTYYYNDNGTWTSTGSYKISTALESRSWDYVSLQQASNYSGVESTYNDDLTDLIAYVQARSDAKLVWHMTWAYQQNSTHSAFPTYGSDQMTMYNAIVSAAQNKIVTNSDIDLIVPNGTAVQNSRTSSLGDTTTRDGYHMSYDYGRYLTGLLFIKTVTGLSIDSITYAPSGVDAEEKAIAIESVNNASVKPFAVTQSAYVEEEPEIPDEGYILLQSALYKGAFWYPINADRYNELVYDMSNSHQYFATIRFTRETLSVGSIIVLADGWQYRPDGWVTDALQTGTREPVTTESYVVVTEDWWGDYTIRAFNISKVGLPSLTNVTEETVRSAFQIYVPEEKHTHSNTSVVTAPTCTEQGYTTYTCTLCGQSTVDSYVNATGHSYETGTCTVCGAEHPNLANYEGKVISILGGSTCTFDGYIPVADGFNLTHRPRYPQSNLLTDVNDTWWMQVIVELGAKLGVNDSWAGSQVLNTLDSNSGDLGPDAAMASLTRIQNLGTNGTPDIILFYGAMNDIGRAVTPGDFNADTAPTQVNLTVTKWDNLADAYVAAIMRMQYYYPDAQIVAMLPGPTASYYTEAERQAYCEVLKAICDHYGVPTVDLSTCGLTTDDMPDGTHPNAEGMDYITAAVLETLLSECKMEVGENVVHSVTHELTGAESSLGYYKGVSNGKPFATTITGENVTVTVTMGGADITDQVYADGQVSISAVTDDVVITAKGKYNADGRLQQLPDNYCCDTNLWTALDPVNEYYTASGWGNNSNSNYSVTFPVTVGDHIWATSFGAAGTNGYTANAVRITWFGEDGVLKSLGRDVVYAEFAEYGYITVPEGAVAVNIPMVSNADTWEIYILNRDHCYESGTCTACGDTQPAPVITAQPADTEVDMGEEFTITVEVEGEGLSYQWYYKDADMDSFAVSGNETATYSDVMQSGMHNRQVYCVITDAYGNTVQSDTATITAAKLPGDANGDGKVNNLDAILILQWCARWDVSVDENAANVNGDGKVNNLDAILILQWCARWDVELLLS